MFKCSRAGLFALISLLPAASLGGDLFEPHPHEPELTPYGSAPAAIVLSPEEKKELAEGDAVLRQSEEKQSGSGVAILHVAAPASLVWDTILHYDEYEKWVKNVDACKVYRTLGDQLFVEMEVSFWWVHSTIYTVNTLHRDEGYISWELDRSRTSDVVDLVGFWRVQEISKDPVMTRVEYASDMVAGGIPKFIVNFLTRDSLTDGTEWVKEQAEREWRQRQTPK